MLYKTNQNPKLMYRSRLEGKLDDVTLDFLSSLSDDLQITLYDILGSQAHTLMLFENKIITKAEAVKILNALEKIKNENISQKSDAEDIHELIESLVIKKRAKKLVEKCLLLDQETTKFLLIHA